MLRLGRWSILFVTLFFTPAKAHDIKGAMLERISGIAQAHAAALAATPTADASTRSVLYNLFLWPVPRKLTICFWSGSTQVRKRVTASMRRMWPLAELTDRRLEFDQVTFDNPPTCAAQPQQDLRVDFKSGDGHWSWPGVVSLQHSRSMNLQGFTENMPPQAEFDRLVAHETGHALGLGHEHQSAQAPVCGWNFDYIRTHYQWESEQQMMAQFDKFVDYIYNDKHAYIFSNYDRRSVMHYAFPRGAFRNGAADPCFIVENEKPSDQDRNALRVAYGPNFPAQQAQTRGAIPEMLTKFANPQFESLRKVMQFKSDLLANQ